MGVTVLTYAWVFSLYCIPSVVSLMIHDSFETPFMRLVDNAPSDRAAHVMMVLIMLIWPVCLLVAVLHLPIFIYKALRYVLGGVTDWF